MFWVSVACFLEGCVGAVHPCTSAAMYTGDQNSLLYRGTCAAVMLLILILSADYNDVRKYYPFFGEITQSLILHFQN